MLKIIIPLLALSNISYAKLGKPIMNGKPVPVSLKNERKDKLSTPFETSNSGSICLMFVKNASKILLAGKANKSCFFYLGEPEKALRYDKIHAIYEYDDKTSPLGWIVEYKGVFAHVFYPMLLPDDENKWPDNFEADFTTSLALPQEESAIITKQGTAKMFKYMGIKTPDLVEIILTPTNNTPNTREELLIKELLITRNKLNEYKAKYNLEKMLNKDLQKQYDEKITQLREQLRAKDEVIAYKDGKIDDLYRELAVYETPKGEIRGLVYDRETGQFNEMSRSEREGKTAEFERDQHENNRERNDPSFERTRHALY